MPTGYTAVIKDGISFNDFVMSCARAFGACVTIRDSDEPIPDKFEPSNHAEDERLKNIEELGRIASLSPTDARLQAIEDWRALRESRQRMNAESDDLKSKYEAMLEKVKAWSPPTEDHQELKAFMIEQIESSIKCDCHAFEMPMREAWHVWQKRKLRELADSVVYYSKEAEAEQERVNSRNEWIKALRESLIAKEDDDGE